MTTARSSTTDQPRAHAAGSQVGATPTLRRGVAAIRRHPQLAFVLLAYAWTRAWWIPLVVSGGGGSHVPGLTAAVVSAMVIAGAVAILRRELTTA